MRYIAARRGSEVIRLQAVYSAVAMGGSIAIMTVFAGFLYQYLGHGVFWVMALVALPAMFCARKLFLMLIRAFCGSAPVDVLSVSGPYRSAVVKRAVTAWYKEQ